MANTPRVLLHAFSTFNLGGPQARFVQLANMCGPKYVHIVAAMDNCFIAGDRLNADVCWEPLNLDIVKGGALANRPLFRSILKSRKPDLLLSYNWGAIEWAAANTPKVVPHVHVEDGFGPEEAHGQLPRRVWMRRVLLAARRVPVIVASRHLGRIARNQWQMPDSRVRFIPNGVTLPDQLEVKPSESHRPLIIGTVAGLRPEKNIGRLIKAFATARKQHDIRLVIVGDGPERGALEELAASLQLSDAIEFAGYLTQPHERLRHFDLFALSSNTEQLPISMLEAMAWGIPVVATRVGDVPDILPEIASDGLAKNDDEAFSAALLGVLSKRSCWPDWIAAGRARAREDYSSERMKVDWKNVFDGNLAAVFK